MLLFIGGYVIVAVAFYSYMVLTAKEEPETSEWVGTTSLPSRDSKRISLHDPVGSRGKRAA